MVDESKVTKIVSNVNENTEYFNKMLSDIVSSYTEDLDNLMSNINRNVISIDNPAVVTIEKYFLELSNCLYFMCDRIEKLGVYDSLSKSSAQEAYNTKYLEHQNINVGVVGGKKPTVAETTATAENAVIYDKLINDVYNKAYKIVNNKVNAAETMLKTLSKILSHRMSEMQLTNMQTGRQILNEGGI